MNRKLVIPLVLICLSLGACSSPRPAAELTAPAASQVEYLIGPGDVLQVFVWRNPELSVTVPVRPDGKISTPLVEDMQAVGKTPSQLARDMEQALSRFVKSPKVNIIVEEFVGNFSEQIRVVGKAAEPKAIPYRRNMTLLDVMIEVGGLAPGAAGNRARIIRRQNGEQVELKVRVDRLLNDGDISQNVMMLPGDVLLIPESRL
ncbi:MAG: sugar ABC transporter substrate-binding protein [Gammaproteobacteria bacterium]|nr:MAG: sugar ABC transporter substrate-binding protein [Gammaproteobacteria bacterium]